MSFADWALFIGILLITMVLVGTYLARLPLSVAMIYLSLGYALGPAGAGAILPDPFLRAMPLETITEAAVLISLFAIGLKLGVPMHFLRWIIPLRLAFPVMAITVGLIAIIGIWGLGLSLGAAVLLGGILAPTDPVLASGIQATAGDAPDQVRFSLAGEGALNDGSAFPFVLLGLGLLGLHPLGEGGWHWWAMDLLWATAGGLLIGTISGALIGKLVIYLRTRHHNAIGLNEFLGLGLIAISYGLSMACMASGFLAVFAAGMALQRVREQPATNSMRLSADTAEKTCSDRLHHHHSHHASANMNLAVQGFNEQLEKLVEMAIVIVIGAMLPYASMPANLWWFIPLLFFVLRPLAVFIGMAGQPLRRHQMVMIGWFGIRGIGSVFYLIFALNKGITGELAQELVSLTLATVVASILFHGISAHPLMKWYVRKKSKGR